MKTLLVQFLFVLFVACSALGQEAMHRGRPIRAWLEELVDDSQEKRDLAERELRVIGTNALPAMLSYITSFGSAFSGHDSSVADNAFRVLGPTAKPAIPRLVQLVPDANYCSDAANALVHIGPDGILSLANTLTNKDARIRVHVLDVVDGHARQSPLPLRFQAMLPAILECAKDSNSRVSIVAMSTLGTITTNEQIRIQAYVLNLGSESAEIRQFAASVLRLSGSQGKVAIPALLKALTDKDEKVREAAGITLQAVAPDEAAKAGVKIRQYE